METNTLVIGASAAGLASAACLKHHDIDFLILEQSDKVAKAWRQHYERLHLHTPRSNSSLPYLPMPASYPHYPSREQVVAYLEAYQQHHQLSPRFDQKVLSVQPREDGRWETKTADTTYTSQHVVVATGYTHTPTIPQWPGRDAFTGHTTHSAQYKNGTPWKDKDVLVVGFGNSGCEIAIDLHEHGARPSMAVRSPVNIVPRDFFGIPILSLGIVMSRLPPKLADLLSAPLMKVLIGDFTRYGLRKLPYGPNTQIQKHARIPLLDIGTLDLIRKGTITIYPGIQEFTADGVTFDDGRSANFDAVVFATGYKPNLASFLPCASQLSLNPQGAPTHSGQESELSGLYFCGFYVSPSGMLREIGIEAKRIADAIKQKQT